MKLNLPYVIARHKQTKNGVWTYYYFRSGVDSKGRGGELTPLPGAPGSQEFTDAYAELMALHAPKRVRTARRASGDDKGTLAWVITQFTAPDNRGWTGLSASTQEVYRQHFDWLRQHCGDILLASFDEDAVREIRSLRAGQGASVANMTLDKLGQLWRWAKEFGGLTGPAKLAGFDPTHGVRRLDTEGEAAPAWTPELCQKFEAQSHQRMITAYYLMRYTGQRKGDCCAMKWSDFSEATGKIFVMPEKTSTKVWVPAHKRLKAYLAALPRESDFILTSPKGSAYRKTSVTNLICSICSDLAFKGYSPHGLRHLAGASLAEAGCSVNQIMAILGHLSERQAYAYVRQANRVRMGEDAVALWEQMDERSEGNVTELAKRRGPKKE